MSNFTAFPRLRPQPLELELPVQRVLAALFPSLLSAARASLAPGDAPEGLALPVLTEDDAWTEAKALAGTIEDHELVDPTLSSERLRSPLPTTR